MESRKVYDEHLSSGTITAQAFHGKHLHRVRLFIIERLLQLRD